MWPISRFVYSKETYVTRFRAGDRCMISSLSLRLSWKWRCVTHASASLSRLYSRQSLHTHRTTTTASSANWTYTNKRKSLCHKQTTHCNCNSSNNVCVKMALVNKFSSVAYIVSAVCVCVRWKMECFSAYKKLCVLLRMKGCMYTYIVVAGSRIYSSLDSEKLIFNPHARADLCTGISRIYIEATTYTTYILYLPQDILIFSLYRCIVYIFCLL